MSFIVSVVNVLIRRKRIDWSSVGETHLNRCLSTLDLTALGVGSTLGLGVYVLAGEVASRTAGPSVVLSFLTAAIASVFAGLCYAEFGARVPKAGSAYVYSYVTVGELKAFVIGWNLILEYVIGTASVARGYSSYIDSLTNGTIQNHFHEWMPIDIKGLSAYPDFLAMAITLLLTIMLAVGVKETTRFEAIFTVLNLAVVIVVVVGGVYHVDFHNWNLQANDTCVTKDEHGSSSGGGFMPFGFSGMMSGAATCFFGFVGFDAIATTGEEAKNPQKSIPISIVLSLLIIFLAYFFTSAIQTLMIPYCMLTPEHTLGAPLPFIFDRAGWPVVGWIIKVGALTGLSTSLLGAMFPLPRVLYAMASDGLIFRFLAKVHPRFKTPVIATILSGIFAGMMAAMFNIQELADMMSIGTLLAYSLVAISVLILRYKESEDDSHSVDLSDFTQPPGAISTSESTSTIYKNSTSDRSNQNYDRIQSPMQQVVNWHNHQRPSRLSSLISIYLIILISCMIAVVTALLVLLEHRLFSGETVSVVVVSVCAANLILLIVMLRRQPTETKKIAFKVPLVPFVPLLSVFTNFYLMMKLSPMTWMRFAVWMVIGFAIYFFYGVWNSSERRRNQVGSEMKTDNDLRR